MNLDKSPLSIEQQTHDRTKKDLASDEKVSIPALAEQEQGKQEEEEEEQEEVPTMSQMYDGQSQATQCLELTQLLEEDDEDNILNSENADTTNENSSKFEEEEEAPIAWSITPWGRLLTTSSHDSNDDGKHRSMDLFPRVPIPHTSITTRSQTLSQQQQEQQHNDDDAIIIISDSETTHTFQGISNLKMSDKFNEYIIGRSAKSDFVAVKRKDAPHDQAWIHSMLSNAHCHIFCMLRTKANNTATRNTKQHLKAAAGGGGGGNANNVNEEEELDMDVFIEDSSGNGTLINNTTLLKRGERRLLHTGDTICLLNPAIVMRKIKGNMEQKDILSHYTFIFVNIHQTQRGLDSTVRNTNVVVGNRNTNVNVNGRSSGVGTSSVASSIGYSSNLKPIQKNLFAAVASISTTNNNNNNNTNTNNLGDGGQSNNNDDDKNKNKSAKKRRGLVDVRATNTKSIQMGQGGNSDNIEIMMPPPKKKVRSSPRLNIQQPPHQSQQQQQQQQQPRIEEVYDIRDELGSGTCGTVRRAIHRRTGQMVAVKIISIGGPGSRNRSTTSDSSIKAEASILQSLHHPYIVPLLDVFIHPGSAIYLVMELLQGGDLFDRIILKGKYTEVESRQVMRRMLAAVHYLHQNRNIVHRDLKPENILCVSRNNDVTVKLTDFGLAKSITDDGLKTFCGTPQYFAPEVLRRQHTIAGQGRYGKEADMWSLGVILYILLSGCPPFDVSGSFDTITETKVEFQDDVWDGISDAAKCLILDLLTPDPKKRISVVDACAHGWILTDDGDSHTHPLDDPALLNVSNEGSGGKNNNTKPHEEDEEDKENNDMNDTKIKTSNSQQSIASTSEDNMNGNGIPATNSTSTPSRSSPAAPQSVLRSPSPPRAGTRAGSIISPQHNIVTGSTAKKSGSTSLACVDVKYSPSPKRMELVAASPNQFANFPTPPCSIKNNISSQDSLFASVKHLSTDAGRINNENIATALKVENELLDKATDIDQNGNTVDQEIEGMKNSPTKYSMGTNTSPEMKVKQTTLSGWFEAPAK